MKLASLNEGRPGVWTERRIVDVSRLVLPWGGHDAMRAIIDGFDELRPRLTAPPNKTKHCQSSR